MKDSERQLLGHLRSALLPLHKRLLEWERKTYERSRGQRMTGGELLKVIVGDPHFAWLHPMSALIVRIDETLDTPDAGYHGYFRRDRRAGAAARDAG